MTLKYVYQSRDQDAKCVSDVAEGGTKPCSPTLSQEVGSDSESNRGTQHVQPKPKLQQHNVQLKQRNVQLKQRNVQLKQRNVQLKQHSELVSPCPSCSDGSQSQLLVYPPPVSPPPGSYPPATTDVFVHPAYPSPWSSCKEVIHPPAVSMPYARVTRILKALNIIEILPKFKAAMIKVCFLFILFSRQFSI